jgi:hypothetical protein
MLNKNKGVRVFMSLQLVVQKIIKQIIIVLCGKFYSRDRIACYKGIDKVLLTQC